MKTMDGHNRRRMKHLLRTFNMPTLPRLPWYQRKAIARWGERTTFDKSFGRWTHQDITVAVYRLEFRAFRRTFEWFGWDFIGEESSHV